MQLKRPPWFDAVLAPVPRRCVNQNYEANVSTLDALSPDMWTLKVADVREMGSYVAKLHRPFLSSPIFYN